MRGIAGAPLRLLVALVLVAGAYLYFSELESGREGAPLGTPSRVGRLDLSEEGAGRGIAPLNASDRYHQERQRSLVDALARRHVGSSIEGGRLEDLRVLQSLLDAGVVEADQTYVLQALGVVLGDVLSAQLGLSWVRVEDQYGRGRALRLEDAQTLLFPVTMISRRIEAGVPVRVEELYREASGMVRRSKSAVSTRRAPGSR